MQLWTLIRGDAPLIVDIPHAGTHVPDAIAYRLTSVARTVPDTDWHVDRLYAIARATGATLLVATHSRYVVDLNRAEDDVDSGVVARDPRPARPHARGLVWRTTTDDEIAIERMRRSS